MVYCYKLPPPSSFKVNKIPLQFFFLKYLCGKTTVALPQLFGGEGGGDKGMGTPTCNQPAPFPLPPPPPRTNDHDDGWSSHSNATHIGGGGHNHTLSPPGIPDFCFPESKEEKKWSNMSKIGKREAMICGARLEKKSLRTSSFLTFSYFRARNCVFLSIALLFCPTVLLLVQKIDVLAATAPPLVPLAPDRSPATFSFHQEEK